MKKSIILLLCVVALLFSACDQGEMTLPNDNTMPDASEYVLGKPLDEAKAYLQKKGYTYLGLGYSESLHMFERGGKVPAQVDDLVTEATEEGVGLWVFNDTVKGFNGVRYFKNIHDAINVYRKWSNHTWRDIVPDAFNWSATIAVPYPEEEQDWGHEYDWKHYADGTYYKNREEIKGHDRSAFEKTLNGLTDVLDMVEHYTRESKPKELEIELQNTEGCIWMYYDNQNYITLWESPFRINKK